MTREATREAVCSKLLVAGGQVALETRVTFHDAFEVMFWGKFEDDLSPNKFQPPL